MASDASARPNTSPAGLLARHPLAFFFIIAFAAAWLMWVPVALSEAGIGLLPFRIPRFWLAVALAATTFAPTLSAFIMTGITEGRIGIRRLLRRYVVWQVKFRWYLCVLLVIPVSEVLGAIVLPGVLVSYQSLTLSLVLAYPAAFVSTFILGGPLGEEPGWRGFALLRLQLLCGPLAGSLILGILWALWHLPMFWSGVWTPPTIPNIVMFILMTTALSITMTWVFNNAKGSLLITMLMHASFNTFANRIVTPLFPAPVLNEYPLLPVLVGFGAVALLVVAVTRGRLGYQYYRQEEKLDSVPSQRKG
jgi:uncharacterized protein